MVDIAAGEKCGTTTVRQMVLKAFRAKNPMLYESLKQRMKGGCYREPSMKLLVEHAVFFGIGPSVKSRSPKDNRFTECVFTAMDAVLPLREHHKDDTANIISILQRMIINQNKLLQADSRN
jgi:hypothetical protein